MVCIVDLCEIPGCGGAPPHGRVLSNEANLEVGFRVLHWHPYGKSLVLVETPASP